MENWHPRYGCRRINSLHVSQLAYLFPFFFVFLKKSTHIINRS